jgi:MYXO-CTERM domain-containing protein
LASGFWIQDVRTSYDAASDTMSVGVRGYQNVAGQEAIFGDSSGNLNPGLDSNPNLGGDKSLAISFAPVSTSGGHQVPGVPVVIAGIPADKSKVGSGTIDGFTVSQDTNTPGLPQYSFGQPLPQFTGNLAFNPSAAHPDLEFTIKNFSKIPGLNASNGYYVQVYAGSAQDIVSGEVSTGWLKVPALQQQTIPEPTSWLAWLVLAGAGAACVIRRRAPVASS